MKKEEKKKTNKLLRIEDTHTKALSRNCRRRRVGKHIFLIYRWSNIRNSNIYTLYPAHIYALRHCDCEIW